MTMVSDGRRGAFYDMHVGAIWQEPAGGFPRCPRQMAGLWCDTWIGSLYGLVASPGKPGLPPRSATKSHAWGAFHDQTHVAPVAQNKQTGA